MHNLTLTNENYYTHDADVAFMSVSQFKSFAGTLGKDACESAALALLNGEISAPESSSMLVGSYVDAYFEGTLDQFKADHPEIFKKTGDKGLKAEYVQAETIIRRIESDQLFSAYLNGRKQVIQTGNLFGVDWKIKMDAYHDDKIVDLKVMRDMNPIWSEKLRTKLDFIHYWGYDIQGAVYQKIVELNTGKKLPFYIACATRESAPNIEVIEITQPHLDKALKFVETNLPHVLTVKNNIVKPVKCNHCSYCLNTKTLTTPITIDELITNSSLYLDTESDDAPNSNTGSALRGFAVFD